MRRIALVVLGILLAARLGAQEADPYAAFSAAGSQLQNGVESIFGASTNLGCNFNHLGSYDQVQIFNQTQNVAGNIIAADGFGDWTCYLELIGSKKGAGIQRFRYESQFQAINTENMNRVNPLDERGKSDTSLEEKQNKLQRLSTDIAPFYKFPEYVIWMREEFFNTAIKIQDSYGKPLRYYPYQTSQATRLLQPDQTHWLDIHLEEILLAKDGRFLGTKVPYRLSYFDLVYQKPVLVKNQVGADREYDLYHPKFSIQGALLQLSGIPVPGTTTWTLDLGYGLSSTGKMILGQVSPDVPLPIENKVTLQRAELGLRYRWGKHSFLAYRGEFMWIYLDNPSQDNPTISLDGINYLSFYWEL